MPATRPAVGYAVLSMLATSAPGLSLVIGLPIAFVLLTSGACLALFIFWGRVRS